MQDTAPAIEEKLAHMAGTLGESSEFISLRRYVEY